MSVDVCILVEGSYPYVSGGVSAWLHNLLRNLPDFRFGIVFLGSRPEVYGKRSYELPPNVVEYQEFYLHDTGWTHTAVPSARASSETSAASESLRAFHLALSTHQPRDACDVLRRLSGPAEERLSAGELFFGIESWELLVELYRRCAPDVSFVDYLWTFRYSHLPLFSLFDARLPEASVYHAISAGFNGLLGALAKIHKGAPFVMTEHGIYTHEREIEIAQSAWIYRPPTASYGTTERLGYFQRWWLEMFYFVAQVAYEMADQVISITAANQRYQLQNGADPAKLTIIPNGIDLQRFQGVRRTEGMHKDEFVVGFVGRVVSIKDVATFIRATKIASETIPNLVAYIVGPTTEEPEYFAQCQQLVRLLGLTGLVHFTGPADVCDYYRLLDVVVLTSLSEAQPLVVLEANCCGIPVIATDVGACRELLEGVSPDDLDLGPSGLLTHAASPRETAAELIHLWSEPATRERMGRAGRERVERFYREDLLYEAYRTLYRRYGALAPTRPTMQAPAAEA